MSYPKMNEQKIEEMRQSFLSLGSMLAVQREFGYNYRTLMKYIGDLLPRYPNDDRFMEVYALTGSLKRTAQILGVGSTATVWRRLKKNNVIVGHGANNWKRLYFTLRRRVSKSQWRADVLAKYNAKCAICQEPSQTVHHQTMTLADIRDMVIKQHPDINPFRSFNELRQFTDLVMEYHNTCDGIVLCRQHHEEQHA